MENEKKYASLETLRSFKENADKLYATQENVDAISSALETKADTTHTHNISDITNLQSSLDSKVPTSRTINGKSLSSNITLTASDMNAYTKSEIDNMELITVDDIDAICGATIQVASMNEVTF